MEAATEVDSEASRAVAGSVAGKGGAVKVMVKAELTVGEVVALTEEVNQVPVEKKGAEMEVA